MGPWQIRSSAQQSMHLIIPDKADSPSTATPTRGQSPASALRTQEAVNPAHQYFDSVLQQRARHVGRGVPAAAANAHAPGQVLTGTQSAPGTAPVTDHHHHHYHPTMPLGSHPAAPQMYRGQPTPAQFTAQGFQQMAHRLSRDAAIHRAYLNQWDRTGGVPGARTPQPRAASPFDAAQRRPSPGPNHEYPTPESLHQRFRGPGAETSLSDAEVQNILRGADARQAILTMTNAMQRSASGTSLGPQSGRATPGTSSPAPSGSGAAAAPPPTSSPSQASPEVYILYSPTGPRALLINSHTSETYYTPPARSASHTPFLGLPNLPAARPHSVQTGTPDQPTPATEQSERDFDDQNDAQVRLRRRIRVRINQPAAQAEPGRPHHPGAAAVIARIWPHFWLAFRLGLFVWWFTSPASSWSRWLAVISIAVAIFVLNTGALDSFADTVWRVICRHMEDLIPMVDPNRPAAERNQDQNQERNQVPQRGPREDPRPGDLAARIVRERRAGNASWLMERVRGMERLGILLLASFAPGVAERHIANLEAEVERQRREAEAAEEARRAAEEGAGDAGADGNVEREGNGNVEGIRHARPSEPSPPPLAEGEAA